MTPSPRLPRRDDADPPRESARARPRRRSMRSASDGPPAAASTSGATSADADVTEPVVNTGTATSAPLSAGAASQPGMTPGAVMLPAMGAAATPPRAAVAQHTSAPKTVDERIAERAYFIYLSRGGYGGDGEALADWVEAERQVLAEQADHPS